jgi:outer membrane protein assembly factor BamB
MHIFRKSVVVVALLVLVISITASAPLSAYKIPLVDGPQTSSIEPQDRIPTPSSNVEDFVADASGVFLPAVNQDSSRAYVKDWPQVQRDPGRTGYSPEKLGKSFDVAWTHPFQPERINPQVQAIVSAGRVFVGTEMGNLYALDAKSGQVEWVYPVGAPVVNSVAVLEGTVFTGAMDGAIYAVGASNGNLVWKKQLSDRLGISTAPLLADDKLFVGGRNGTFYAIEPDSGSILWTYETGAPILQTAAWSRGLVVFGAMDMRVYALYSANGTLAWRSVRLSGVALKDYWPVIWNGKVIVRTMDFGDIDPGFPFEWFGASSDWSWLSKYGPTIAAGGLANVPDAMQAQNQAIADYYANPSGNEISLYILDESSGQQSIVVPQWTVQTMHGATAPPCVDRDGTLVVPVLFVRSGWGRLDLQKQRIVDILYDQKTRQGDPLQPNDTPAGMGNKDENLNVTCAENMILAMHIQEGNANFTGWFDQDERSWHLLGAGYTSGEMSSNTQGGGANPASIANGMVYHISFHELIARNTRP